MSRWLFALSVLGACSSATSISASAAPDEQPGPPVAPAEPAVKFDAAPQEEPELEEREAPAELRLLAISTDGRRALLGMLHPVGRAPELRSVDIATNQVVARAEMLAVAALPRSMFGGPEVEREFEKSLRGNRLLAEDLGGVAPLLAGFPLRTAGDYASLDAANLAYVADAQRITVMRDGDPAAQRITGEDPWIAPDGRTLLYKQEGLYAMPFAGGTPTRIPGTDQLAPHAPVAVRSPTVLRTLEVHERTICAVDVSLAQLRVVHRTCTPRTCADCTTDLPALSPSGDYLAWREVEARRIRARAMNLATEAVVDAPVDPGEGLVVSDRGRVHAGRDCRFRGDDLVCVRGERVVVSAGR